MSAMNLRRIALVGLIMSLIYFTCGPSMARLVEDWSYERMNKDSDLVVIATAVSTADAKESFRDDRWPIKFVGQDTVFEVRVVLKGRTDDNKKITVLHYKGELARDKDDDKLLAIIDGPEFVKFTSKPAKIEHAGLTLEDHKFEYLLFLKKRSDGRYELLSGNLDPEESVREVFSPYYCRKDTDIFEKKAGKKEEKEKKPDAPQPDKPQPDKPSGLSKPDEKTGETAKETAQQMDLHTASLFHRRLAKVITKHAFVAVNYVGALAISRPPAGEEPLDNEDDNVKWAFTKVNEHGCDLHEIILEIGVSLKRRSDTVATCKVNGKTLYIHVVKLPEKWTVDTQMPQAKKGTTVRKLLEKLQAESEEAPSSSSKDTSESKPMEQGKEKDGQPDKPQKP